MKRLVLLLALALPACGLQPLYEGGASGTVARGLAADRSRADRRQVRLSDDQRAARSACPIGGGAAAKYRLEIKLDDSIIGLGVRRDNTVTRERRSLRARYQLVDAATGETLLDATAGSDAGIDVVEFRICHHRGREYRAGKSVEHRRRSDRHADRGLYAPHRGQVKASENQLVNALDAASPAIRLYLLHGPDEAGAAELAARLGRALGADAEKVAIDGSSLKSDPGRYGR